MKGILLIAQHPIEALGFWWRTVLRLIKKNSGVKNSYNSLYFFLAIIPCASKGH
ncbi:hypothetical protein SAMN02745866_03588 [Alteromonadaceae bacterium Bs31]|nr:hypothetical protein SAMN02745866_03588 [Alteromonadaceae bacterium Bs31]